MNYKLILKLLGNMLCIEAVFMTVPLIVSFIYGGNDSAPFINSILICLAFGIPMSLLRPKNKNFSVKDAFAAASFTWIIFSVFGALPFFFSGCFSSFIDCVFESVSGFTTTGASILTDIESLPKGISFWRSFSHWVGGMGVIVFMMAVVPSMNASSVNLLRAESTGPSPSKIVPKLRKTAGILYLIYFTMTVVLIILLILVGLPVYDAFIHAFSTAGTGGFSNMNASVGAYGNTAAEIIITIFMFLFGISFSLYFFLLRGNLKQFFKDEELRLYIGVVLCSITIISINIFGLYDSAAVALKDSAFQVSSIITTTGFATADFNKWPSLSQGILMLIMLTGCCAGSTGGGIKLVRVIYLFKSLKIEINRILHPGITKTLMIDGKKVDNDVALKTALFIFVYLTIFVFATLVVSIDGKDITTNSTAVISMLSNVGPGLNEVGPIGNYSSFSSFSKLVLSFCMIAGRLEFFPVLILLNPFKVIKIK